MFLEMHFSVTESIIDTDILSFYFKSDSKVIDQFGNDLKEFDQINISIITYHEILASSKFKKAQKKIQEFEEFVANNNIIYLSEESAKRSGDIYVDLRKKGITIGTSDLPIAGIALDNSLTLITNNEKHFEPIKGLKTENRKK